MLTNVLHIIMHDMYYYNVTSIKSVQITRFQLKHETVKHDSGWNSFKVVKG